MTRDRVTGFIALALGCAVAAATAQLPPSSMAGDVGPKVFPYISAALLIICGLGLCITGKKQSPVYYNKKQLGRLALIFGIVLAYVVAMTCIGYTAASFAALYVLCTLFAKGKNISVVKRLLFTVLMTAAMYLIFTKLFSIALPKGILF